MIDREKLEKMHAEGFNCAQCVAAYFAEQAGMDEKTAKAATGGFGGGFRTGSICGAASAGVMVLGLLNPYDDASSNSAKARIADLSREFIRRFTERYGYLNCHDLKSRGLISCDELICGAAEIVDEMITK